MNQLVVCLGPALVGGLVWQKLQTPQADAPAGSFVFRNAGWLVAAVLLGFAVLRNIPVYPLTLLAPH